MNLSKTKQAPTSQIEEFIFQDFLLARRQNCPSENVTSDFVFVFENDSKTDATFVMHTMLNSYLKQGFNVCFVSLTQSFGHYNSVSQKLGVDLKSLRESKQLVFVEGLKHLGNSIISQSDNVSIAETDDFRSLIYNNSLCELYNNLITYVDQLGSEGKPVAVMIDDISMLLSIGVLSKDIVSLCHSLQSHLTQRKLGPLITLSNNYGDDDDCLSMVKFLRHLCTVSIQISSLPSGYCKDVHGQMKILRRNQLGRNKAIERTVQFKVNDKNVNLFAVGLSLAVL
ncbi:hypothetical protein LOTGIDRAFT_238994 [Lottia gigantea]|uniref:Elongator complex protein 6 n=1 Tax=Lottia gigantea TaxID=225164 RepID=V4CA21_LOTGI|nr:hypothetical protein LOTGIDRAFT_238994 [Lottia gigantea]ESO98639.1 hypothetical protein LOTGIDRAFT_238994 [Lottia gigantea]